MPGNRFRALERATLGLSNPLRRATECAVGLWYRVGYRLNDHLIMVLAHRRTAYDLPLYFRSAELADALSPTVSEALRLIERHDNRRFQRLRRDVARVFVAPLKTTFLSGHTGTCWLRERTAIEQGPLAVASMLVHEGVHARLRKMGVVQHRPKYRMVRTEEFCCREEIAFARSISERDLPEKRAWIELIHRRFQAFIDQNLR